MKNKPPDTREQSIAHSLALIAAELKLIRAELEKMGNPYNRSGHTAELKAIREALEKMANPHLEPTPVRFEFPKP